jgi:hypothetical protein
VRQGRRTSTTELVAALRDSYGEVVPLRRDALAGLCPLARGLRERG